MCCFCDEVHNEDGCWRIFQYSYPSAGLLTSGSQLNLDQLSPHERKEESVCFVSPPHEVIWPSRVTGDKPVRQCRVVGILRYFPQGTLRVSFLPPDMFCILSLLSVTLFS